MKKILAVLILMSVMLTAVSCSGGETVSEKSNTATKTTATTTTATVPVKTTTQPITTKATTTTVKPTAKSTIKSTLLISTTKKQRTEKPSLVKKGPRPRRYEDIYVTSFDGTKEQFRTQVIDSLIQNEEDFNKFIGYVSQNYCIEKEDCFINNQGSSCSLSKSVDGVEIVTEIENIEDTVILDFVKQYGVSTFLRSTDSSSFRFVGHTNEGYEDFTLKRIEDNYDSSYELKHDVVIPNKWICIRWN